MELGNVGNHGYAELDCLDLDLARLSAAWARLVERHDMLRAVVLGDGRQQILEQVPDYAIAIQELRGLAPAAVERRLAATRERMSHEVRPADRWPLFELLASRLDARRILLHISMDLLVCDLRSLHVLFRELVRLYDDPGAVLPPLAVTFRDCVLGELELRESPALRRARAYWSERLPALPPAPKLPLAQRPTELVHPRFVRRRAHLEAATWARLKERATAAGLTPTALLVAAFSEVLATWSEEPRFTLNLPTGQRLPLHPQVDEVVGAFASFILLEVDAGEAEPFARRARRIQEQLWRDLEQQHGGGVWVLRELARREGRPPGAVMPIVFTSTVGLGGEGTFASLERLGETVFEVSQTPQVWLDHLLYEQDGGVVLDWDAVDALFPPGMLDTMFSAYLELLRRLAGEEEAWELPSRLVPPDQLAQRAAINATAAPVPELSLPQLFRAREVERGDAAAVVWRGGSLSYRELGRRSARLARRLRDLGAERDRPVAVVMEKGWEQVVAALAVVEAGAAYLPLDPAWPRERLGALLASAGVAMALTQPRLAATLAWPPGVRVLAVDGDELAAAAASDAPPAPPPAPHDLAYVLFTSGSTGRPKGVMIEHRSVVNRVLDVNRRWRVGTGDRALALTPLHHDLSVYDLFGTLAAGGTIVLPDAAPRPDPGHWAELVGEQGVTVWNSVPAFLEMLVEVLEAAGAPGSRPLAGLRLVLLAGDWIPVTLPDRVRALAPGVEVVSLGGPTETTIWDVCYPIGAVDPAWRTVPYGRPMTNATYHVLGPALAERPVWVAGELYIGGAGLARGYRGDEEATRERFLVHPATGERLYKSGDRGRWLPDGHLEFLGRDDLQVKVQGQRLELGEIEAALQQHSKVRRAAAVVQGEARVVAFVVPEPAAAEAARDLAARLDLKLRRPGIRRPRPDQPSIPLLRRDPDAAEIARYAERRSFRRFDPRPIRLAELGGWLSCLRQVELPGSPLPKYRYPSGGGLYPVQAYLAVKAERVAGLAEGTYYYDPRDHRLVLLTAGARCEERLHLPANRELFARSALSLFLVAQMQAIVPVYGDAAREFCLLEAGYMTQLLMSEAPACDLGFCPVGQLEFAPLAAAFLLEESHELMATLVGGAIEPRQKTAAAFREELEEAAAPVAPDLAAELRAWLRERLPAYAVPAAVEIAESLPITANGKVDRRALAARPVAAAPRPEADAGPPNALESAVAELWRQVLRLDADALDLDANFFELGGTSLHLVQVYRRLRETFPGPFSTNELFRHPTVRSLARFLGEAQPAPSVFAAGRDRAELRRAARRRRNGTAV